MIVCSIIKNRFHLPLASKILRLSFKEEKPSTKQQKKEPENKQLSCTSQINCSRSSSCRQSQSSESIKTSSTPKQQQQFQVDLQVSSLYKQILEQQRARMQKNQLRIQEMLQKQRQRSDKKQEQLHQQIREFMKSLQTLIGVGGLMGLVYYIFTVVNAGGDAFEKMKKYWDQSYTKYELVQKYSQNQQKLPAYYSQGNSIEKQLSKIQFDGIIGMTYLVGIPGSGKTTALKKVINCLRDKISKGQSRWSKVYYINLRVDDENGKILLYKTKQRIDEMSMLLKSIFSSQKNYKDALIIIDDIQMLERVLPDQQTKQILESILLKCQMQSCKFVLVSSSSLSYYRALESIGYKKSAYMSEIQNMSPSDLKSAINKRVQYEAQTNKIEIPQKIVQFLCQYDSIKSIMNAINIITNEYRIQKWLNSTPISQIKQLQKLKQIDNNKIWDMKISITKLIRQKSKIIQKKAIAQIIRCILQLPLQISIIDKFTVIKNVVRKYPQLRYYLDQISNVIDELDQKNILIFGHPRTKLQRKALQQVLQAIQ